MASRILLRPEVREIIEGALTRLQLDAFLFALAGYNERQIAELMDRSRATVRDHLNAAYRNCRRAGVRFHPNGEPYLEEGHEPNTQAFLPPPGRGDGPPQGGGNPHGDGSGGAASHYGDGDIAGR